MTIVNYDELKGHVGHKIVCVHYKDVITSANSKTGKVTTTDEVTIECETCHEILHNEFKVSSDV
jgi:hypothetical protein